MPVILTTNEERGIWGLVNEAKALADRRAWTRGGFRQTTYLLRGGLRRR
jgi:hypothetical protein